MQYEFGTGTLFGVSTTGASPATPVRFGALQGVTIDFAFTQKELYGSYQFPLALARGTAKITGKADFAQFNAQIFNDLFFGESAVADGTIRTEVGEAGTVTANAVTVTHNGAGNFVQDLGVTLASNGAVYTRVANAPVGLQYVANETTGVYTFNASQNNVAVSISYTWNAPSTGKKITINNQLLGTAPQFKAVFTQAFQGKKMTVVLNTCMSSKLSLVTKLEDFTIPAFDFAAFSDESNAIGSISLEE